MKFAIFCLFIFSSISLKAQYFEQDTVKLENTVVCLDFITPGATLEKSLNRRKSLYFAVSTGFALLSENSSRGSTTSYVVVPVLYAQYRSYYNLDRRSRRLKNTGYNSGNYLGLHVGYQGSPIAGENIGRIESEKGALIGPVWGIQRNGILAFEFSVGIGYFTGERTKGATIFGDLSLGLNLSKLIKKR